VLDSDHMLDTAVLHELHWDFADGTANGVWLTSCQKTRDQVEPRYGLDKAFSTGMPDPDMPVVRHKKPGQRGFIRACLNTNCCDQSTSTIVHVCCALWLARSATTNQPPRMLHDVLKGVSAGLFFLFYLCCLCCFGTSAFSLSFDGCLAMPVSC